MIVVNYFIHGDCNALTTLTGITGDEGIFSSNDFEPAVPPLTGSVKMFFNMSGLSFLHM